MSVRRLGPLLLGAAMILAVTPGHAQSPAQSWAQQQQAQAWATARLDRSPRRHEWVTLAHGDRTLRAFVTYPDSAGPAPVILVLHEVFGLTDSTRNTADEIAAMGYITVTPDMLSGFAPNGGGTADFPTTHMAGAVMTSLPDATVDAAISAWSGFARRLPGTDGRLALVGLSWGGGAAFRHAAAVREPGLRTVCVFYDVGPPAATQGPDRGTASAPSLSVTGIGIPVHGFYGSADTRAVSSIAATRDAMAAAGKPFDPVVYEGAEHAFMRLGEDPADRNPANAAALRASLARLEAVLRGM